MNKSLIRGASRVCLLVAMFLALPAQAFAQAPDAGHAAGHWPYALPIWGEKLAERGMKFPLPFGIGLNYAYINQPIKITRIAVGVNDSEMVDLSQLITFGDLDSTVHALNLRADLWVLPFLNVYGMANYALNAQTDVAIVEPFSFDAGASQSGYGGGFGFTMAGGAFGFFGTVDLNWTWNKMQKLEEPVGTFLLTPRVGKNLGKLAGLEFIVWVGAMRQVIESETKGSIRLSDAIGDTGFKDDLAAWYDSLPPGQQAVVEGIVSRLGGVGDPVIHYDLDKAVDQKWNALVGTEIGLTDAWRIRAELGFLGRTQVIAGLNYRFGGPQKSPTPGAPPPP